MSTYRVGYFVARLSLVMAFAVLVIGLAGSAVAWSIYSSRIEAARIPTDAGLVDAIAAINSAQRGAIEELRTAGLPVSRAELLAPRQFAGVESVSELNRRLELLASARAVVLANQREVVAKVDAGFDEIIGQLNDLARRTTAAVPSPDDAVPAPSPTPPVEANQDPELPTPLYGPDTGGGAFKQRMQALDAAKVALLSLLTEVQKPENRFRIEALLSEVSNLEKLVARAAQENPEQREKFDEEDAVNQPSTSRAVQIAAALEKRKAGVLTAVLGDWAVLERIDAVTRQLENRRQLVEVSQAAITSLQFQRNVVIAAVIICAVLLAIVLGAAGDVARAILDCAKHLGSL